MYKQASIGWLWHQLWYFFIWSCSTPKSSTWEQQPSKMASYICFTQDLGPEQAKLCLLNQRLVFTPYLKGQRAWASRSECRVIFHGRFTFTRPFRNYKLNTTLDVFSYGWRHIFSHARILPAKHGTILDGRDSTKIEGLWAVDKLVVWVWCLTG